MKKIILDTLHRSLGAKMVPFAGYDMPVSYKGILEEHKSVRTAVGLFDVSHMGVLRVHGAGAASLLSKVLTKNASQTAIGKGSYALLCNESGGTIDDLIFYREAADDYYVALNASNKDGDLAWIRDYAAQSKEAVLLEPLFDSHALLALQGPRAAELLQELKVTLDVTQLYTSGVFPIAGVSCRIFVSGYTGERGCEISCPVEGAEKVFKELMSVGEKYGLQPIGLGARDTLRTEMGYSLYGHELNLTINPVEAALSWAIDFDDRSFVGKEALQKAKANPERKLIALQNKNSRQAPRGEMKVFDSQNNEVGFVTSGTFSPSLGYVVGLAIVAKKSEAPYTIDIRGQKVAFELTKRPFLKK